jgi:nicotinamidase-related amidase
MNLSEQPEKEIFPILVQDFELIPEKVTLFVIDMQNFAVHPDYGWGPVLRKSYPEIYRYFSDRLSDHVIPNIQRLLDFFRQRKLQIIYFTVGSFLPDGKDFLRMRRNASSKGVIPTIGSKGSPDHEIIKQLSPKRGEVVLNKVSQGAFTSTGVDLILRNLGVDTLILTGVHTNNCVETTARQAVDLGYQTVLVNDATAAFDQESQDASLRTFRRFLGKVYWTDDVIALLNKI